MYYTSLERGSSELSIDAKLMYDRFNEMLLLFTETLSLFRATKVDVGLQRSARGGRQKSTLGPRGLICCKSHRSYSSLDLNGISLEDINILKKSEV